MLTSCSFHGGKRDMGIRFRQRLFGWWAVLALEEDPRDL